MTKFIDVSRIQAKEKKETVFTHFLNGNSWEKASLAPSFYSQVTYLGKHGSIGHIFVAYEVGSNVVVIYKGTKGSEFD